MSAKKKTTRPKKVAVKKVAAKSVAKKTVRKKPSASGVLPWTRLAEALGFSYNSLAKWREMDGAPKERTVEAWQKFIDERGLGNVGNRVGKDREYWLTLKAQNETILQDIKIQKERAQVVDTEKVDQLLSRIALAQRPLLYLKMEQQLPQALAGKSMAEMRIEMRKAADAICDAMVRPIEEWKKSLARDIHTEDS